jgi:hypothetical protein
VLVPEIAMQVMASGGNRPLAMFIGSVRAELAHHDASGAS